MSDWDKRNNGGQQDDGQQPQQAKPKSGRAGRPKGSGTGTKKKKDEPKTDLNQVITPYVYIPQEHPFLLNYDDICQNRGVTAQMVSRLMPPHAVSIERMTQVLREDGSVAYVEMRMLTTNHTKDYRTIYIADVEGSDDPNKDGIGMLRVGFDKLAEQGLYTPSNAPELVAAQRHVEANPDLTLAIFWCEGDKAGCAVGERLKTAFAQGILRERKLHAVASATIGGMSGVRKTNYALRPRSGTNPRFIIDGVNSTALRLENATHFIVRDNDEAGKEEAHILTERLEKEYGVSLARIHVVLPPANAFEGWDDADDLPDGVAEQDRILQILDTAPVGTTWGKFQISNAWPDGTDKAGVPKKGMRNCMIAIEDMGLKIQRDLFKQKDFINGEVLSNAHLIELRDEIASKYDFDGGRDNVFDAVVTLAQRDAYHPLLSYLDGLEWDGVSRLDTWMTTYLSAADTELNRNIGKLMMAAAVRRVRNPGVKFDTIIVWEGGQGTGKSSALRILAGDEYFSDVDIVHVPSKEQAERLQGVWIQEIAELVGMSKADVNAIKNFASRQVDRTRPAYARVVEDFPRTCLLVGTTNEESYLRDLTGNRRFLPMKTGQVDLAGLARDRDQLWAEAVQLEKTWGSLILPEELWDEAASEQKARMTTDHLEDVLARLTPEDCTIEGHSSEFYRIPYTAVFEFVQARTKENWSRIPYARLNHVMKNLGWQVNVYVQCTVYENGNAKKRQLRCFQRPVAGWDAAEAESAEPPEDDLPF